MEVTTQATVRVWDDEQGWGVLDSPATPGGCWTHYSAVDVAGYRTLSPAQQVELVGEQPGQDGYAWRAVRVTVPGAAAAPPAGPSSAYSSELTIVRDQD